MVAEIVAISDVDFITYKAQWGQKLQYNQNAHNCMEKVYHGFCLLGLTTKFKIMNPDSIDI